MQGEQDILLLISFGIVAMLILVFGIVLYSIQYHKRGISTKLEIEKLKNQQQKDLITTITKVQESERRRISANLHDEIGASLSAVSIMIDEASMITDGRANTLVTKADSQLQKTIEEIRNIIQDISPAIVEKFGLYEAISEICCSINEIKKVSVYFDAKIKSPIDDKAIELKIYRIVQELVNNTLKHANATIIKIKASIIDDCFIISVTDNGKGINLAAAKKSKSLGLENIRAQMEFIEGKFEIKNRNEGGTSATVFVPIEKTLILHKTKK